jgi:hypothetical protein
LFINFSKLPFYSCAEPLKKLSGQISAMAIKARTYPKTGIYPETLLLIIIIFHCTAKS